MIAKKLTRPTPMGLQGPPYDGASRQGHGSPVDLGAIQTRKVDSMSELVAEMLLDADATLPPPRTAPSAASFSAVHFAGTHPRDSQRPLALDLDDAIPQFRSRTGKVIVIALLFVLAIAGGLAAVLLSQG